MDVSSIADLATSMSQTRTQQDIQVAVLKRALDSQSESALGLLAALPQPDSVNLPAHLGQNINTTA